MTVWRCGKLWEEGCLQPTGGELAANSGGAGGAIVGDDIFGGDGAALLEGLHELLKAAELSGGWSRLIEVADEADGDATSGDGRGGGGGGLLKIPSGVDLDLAVGRVVAVADDEMIAGGNRFRAAGAAVVDEDVLPAGGLEGNPCVENLVEVGGRIDDHEAARVGEHGGGGQGEQE